MEVSAHQGKQVGVGTLVLMLVALGWSGVLVLVVAAGGCCVCWLDQSKDTLNMVGN